MSRRDQMHLVKTLNQKSQRVTLVIMRMPDADLTFAAHTNAIANDSPIGRTAIVDTDNFSTSSGSFTFNRRETRIAAGA